MFETPNIVDIKSIEVAISNREGLELPTGRYDIAKDNWAGTLEYMQPNKKYAEKLDDDIFPVICTVSIASKDDASQQFAIRWMGKNPLLISRDGASWYWGAQVPEVSDTALGFVSFVKKHGKKKVDNKP